MLDSLAVISDVTGTCPVAVGTTSSSRRKAVASTAGGLASGLRPLHLPQPSLVPVTVIGRRPTAWCQSAWVSLPDSSVRCRCEPVLGSCLSI
jgi:hypothetical protein